MRYNFLYNSGVYRLIFPNGKCYIGQSIDLVHRIDVHKCSYCPGQPKLCRAIKKYGWKNIKVQILIYASDKYNLNIAEKYFIEKYNSQTNGYNITNGGSSFRHNQETKNKISKSNKGKIQSKNAREKMSINHKLLGKNDRYSDQFGVSWAKSCNKWVVIIHDKYIRAFENEKDAIIVAKALLKEPLSLEELVIFDNLYQDIIKSQNRKKELIVSKQRGVSWRKNKWQVRVEDKSYGVFLLEEDAIKIAKLIYKYKDGYDITDDELELIKPKTVKSYSGHEGVYFTKGRNTWRVVVFHKHYGYFKTKEEAIMKAKEVYSKIEKEKLNGSPTLN